MQRRAVGRDEGGGGGERGGGEGRRERPTCTYIDPQTRRRGLVSKCSVMVMMCTVHRPAEVTECCGMVMATELSLCGVPPPGLCGADKGEGGLCCEQWTSDLSQQCRWMCTPIPALWSQ